MIWALVGTAFAHPFETSEYSYRTAVKVSDSGFVGLVVLEIPIPVVLEGIGVESEDSKRVKKQKVEAFDQATFDAMASGLTLTIDGQVQDVAWRPIAHEMNGKAAEGFFLYMVQTHVPAGDLPAEGYTAVVTNTGYADEEMVYSGGANAVEPWTITGSTADELLGEKKGLALDEPDRWTRDAGMRTFSVTATK